jgi:hypothetical protein
LYSTLSPLQVSGSLTSSVVDDAFFILKKCGSRALATRSIHCVCAILGQLNDLLANKLKGALLAHIGSGPGKLLAGAPALPGAADAGGERADITLCIVVADLLSSVCCRLEGCLWVGEAWGNVVGCNWLLPPISMLRAF